MKKNEYKKSRETVPLRVAVIQKRQKSREAVPLRENSKPHQQMENVFYADSEMTNMFL